MKVCERKPCLFDDKGRILISIPSTGGYMFFLGAVEWLGPHRDRFEDKMRELETKRIWKWITTKQPREPYYLDHQTLIYMFQVLQH